MADLLKGPRGTQVTIMVSREGSDEPIVFNIIRDEINRNSVKDAFWLKPGIAYVKSNSSTKPPARRWKKR